jgi:tetratricopeptide (TPR) repeat protein
VAALHGLAVTSLARGLGRNLAGQIQAEILLTPGLPGEVLISLLLLGPVLAAATLLWAAAAPSRAPALLGLLLLGAAAGLILAGSGGPASRPWVGLIRGALLPAIFLFLASVGLLREDGQEPSPGEGRALSVEGQIGCALVMAVAGLSSSTLWFALSRIGILAGGRDLTPWVSAFVVLAGAGAGALVLPGAAGRRGKPWRSISFALALTGALGLLTATLADLAPAAALEVMARTGMGPLSEGTAAAAVAFLTFLGPALFIGAAAGSAAVPRGSGAYLALAVLCAAAALPAAPLLTAGLGLRSLLLASSVTLVITAGLATLLGPGSLVHRALRALFLLALGLAALQSGERWKIGRFLAAPVHHPARYLEGGRSVLDDRISRDRTLAYADGERASAALVLVEGAEVSAFVDGRSRRIGGAEAQRSLALSAHLPALMGPGEGRALILGGLMGRGHQALTLHGPFRMEVAAADRGLVGLFLASRAILQPGRISPPEPPPIIHEGSFLRVLSARPESFDLILAPPQVDPAPLVDLLDEGSLGRLRAALRPGGMASVALPLDGLDTEGIQVSAAAFATAFPGATAWIAPTELILLGGEPGRPPDLGRLLERTREGGVAEDLTSIGMDDPLKILSLQIDLRSLVTATPSHTLRQATPILRRSLSSARLNPPMEGNLRWLIREHGRTDPPITFPTRFSPAARRSARQRLGVLREVARMNLRARLAFARGDGNAALTAAGEAFRRDPADQEGRLLMARALIGEADRALARGEVARARRGYTEALDLDPASLEALSDLAWIRYGDGDRAGAERLLGRAAGRAPWIAQLQYRLGLLRYEAGDVDGAEERLQEAFRLDPGQPEPLIWSPDGAPPRSTRPSPPPTWKRATWMMPRLRWRRPCRRSRGMPRRC